MSQKFPIFLPLAIRKILWVIFGSLLVIGLRLWQLTCLHQEAYQDLAESPKKRTLIEKAPRGQIVDRHGTLLATNEISYEACIYYGEILQIPSQKWDKAFSQKKIYPRKAYLLSFSKFLAEKLQLDAQRVEDRIYSHAALFPNLPYTIKENLTEKEYYHLKLLEKDWPGLRVEKKEKRVYPQGKVACDVIGYLGALNQKEYHKIGEEILRLNQYIESPDLPLPQGYQNLEEVVLKLKELKEKAYSYHDFLGKTGLEAFYEKDLRGFWGKTQYEIDPKGTFLRTLPGNIPPIAGKKILTNLCLTLQKKAESLLAQQEKEFAYSFYKKKKPWIRGGSIVVMDPHNGEILALASSPRYDPNDFLPQGKGSKEKNYKQVHKWLESSQYLQELWENKQPLQREFYEEKTERFETEERYLDWKNYLTFLFPKDSPWISKLENLSLQKAVELQEDWEKVLFFLAEKDSTKIPPTFFSSPFHADPNVQKIATKWHRFFQAALDFRDQLFVIDLCRLIVYSPAFSDALLQKVGEMSLSSYFALQREIYSVKSQVEQETKKAFYAQIFPKWREENQKEFLEALRDQEKKKGVYPKPFLDHLDQQREKLFQEFWAENQQKILTLFLKQEAFEAPLAFLKNSFSSVILPCSLQRWAESLEFSLVEQLLKTARPFSELDRPLLMKYPYFSKLKTPLERDLALAFYPKERFGYGRSYAFRQICPLGSSFKLITAYARLLQHYQNTQKPFAFTIYDEYKWDPKIQSYVVGYTEDLKPIPRIFKGGRLPRSSRLSMGKIDLPSAFEQSSNPYFSLLAYQLKNPEDLTLYAKKFGLGAKTCIDLPGEIAGALPEDISYSLSGLFSFAIGQHAFSATPLQAAVMMGAFANGGRVVIPKIAKALVGKNRILHPPFFPNKNLYCQKHLEALGIPYSLFSHELASETVAELFPYQAKNQLPFSKAIQEAIFEGLDRSVWGKKGTARPSTIRSLLKDPRKMEEYLKFSHAFIAKTSTSEVMANLSVNPSSKAEIYNHAWFSAISFEEGKKTKWAHPELIVIVYLPFAKSGKEGAPVAMELIKLYRKLQSDKKASSSAGSEASS